MIKEITTSELNTYRAEKNVKIIDVRPVDAYNGWQLEGEPRGGHIPGAKSLDVAWCEYIDWIEIVKSKRILPHHHLVLYGYNNAQATKVANLLQKTGYSNISIYNHFVDEWSSNDELPLNRLAKYEQLVPPSWVNSLINGKQPKHFNGNNFVICQSHYRNRDAYLSGHIPGAIDIDTNSLESQDTWNRRSPEELEETLLQHGITSDTTVVLYGKFQFPNNDDPFPGSAAGHLGAMRCAFIMMYAGVKDVRILNGGFQSWKDSGFEISYEDVKKSPASGFGVNIPAKPELAVDMPQAKNMLQAGNADLVCVRSWSEYIGEVSGYNYIEKTGRIPGAKFSNCGSDAYHMENYTNLDHTTREYQEIEENLRNSGISREKHNAFYCGTGWRGSEAFINAYLMGWPKVSVFDGGWFEWSNDPDNPTERGAK